MARRILVLLVVGSFAAPAAGPAAPVLAQHTIPEGPSELTLDLAPARPDSPAALVLHVEYRSPVGPDAKPPALAGARIETPVGTRFDLAGAPACPATDLEFHLLGPGACPPGSQVATGTLLAVTGLGAAVDPFTTDLVVFNTGRGVVTLVTLPGTPLVLAIDRITITANVLDAHPPAILGGPPDLRTAVRSIHYVFPADTGFVVTPPTCPDSGRWEAVATIAFADGTRQRASGAIGCEPSPATSAAPPAAPSAAPASVARHASTLPVTGTGHRGSWTVLLAALGGVGAAVILRTGRSASQHLADERRP